MAKKYNLTDYKFAMEVVKELPIVIDKLDNVLKLLNEHKKYAAVQAVMDTIEVSTNSLSRNLKHYRKVVSLRGAKE